MPRDLPAAETIRTAILDAVGTLGPGKTLCPSEIAKALTASQNQNDLNQDWRPLLKPVRTEAMALAGAGRIGIYRKGKLVLDLAAVKGVIRLGCADGRNGPDHGRHGASDTDSQHEG